MTPRRSGARGAAAVLAIGLAPAAAGQGVDLSPAERTWLAEHSVIRVEVSTERPPLEFRAGGEYRGILPDYLRLLEGPLGVRFAFEPRLEPDLLPRSDPLLRTAGAEDDRWAALPAWVRLPVAIVARQGRAGVDELEALRGLRIGMQACSPAQAFLQRRFPELSFELVAEVPDGLRRVASGELDAFLGEEPLVLHALQAGAVAGLAVAGSAGFSAPQALQVRRDLPVLAGILAKAVAAVSAEERARILQRWLPGKDGRGWLRLLGLLGAAVALLAGGFVAARVQRSARRRERRAQAAQEQGERLAALGTLVAGVAHEINNPNHAIMLNVPVLREAWRDALPVLDGHARGDPGLRLANVPYGDMRDDLARMTSEILTSAERIRDIVAALRAYARDQRGEPAVLDLAAAVRAAIAARRETLVAATACFRSELPGEPVAVVGDRLQLEHVAAELLGIACRSLTTREEAIAVHLWADRARGEAVLSVRDEGRGLPQGRAVASVRPFPPANGAGTEGTRLPILAWIVRQHRGTLAVESPAGVGTTVTVRLPLAPG